jgi:Acetyltransferase (GNAT) domain
MSINPGFFSTLATGRRLAVQEAAVAMMSSTLDRAGTNPKSRNGKPPINPEEFYLTPPTGADQEILARHVPKIDFGPLNALRKKVKLNEMTAAAVIMFGETSPKIPCLAVRLVNNDQCVGLVRFENVTKDDQGTSLGKSTFEPSYCIFPGHEGVRLGGQAVLRSIHYWIHEDPTMKINPTIVRVTNNTRVKRLWATVEPYNHPSVAILQTMGLIEGRSILPANSPYCDKSGKPSARVVFTGNVEDNVVPALSSVLEKRYSMKTRVIVPTVT